MPASAAAVSWNYDSCADSGLGYSPPGMRGKCGEPDLQQIEMDILCFLLAILARGGARLKDSAFRALSFYVSPPHPCRSVPFEV